MAELFRPAREDFEPLGCHNEQQADDGPLVHWHDAGAVDQGIITHDDGRPRSLYIRLADLRTPFGLVLQLGPDDAEEVGRNLLDEAERFRRMRSN